MNSVYEEVKKLLWVIYGLFCQILDFLTLKTFSCAKVKVTYASFSIVSDRDCIYAYICQVLTQYIMEQRKYGIFSADFKPKCRFSRTQGQGHGCQLFLIFGMHM